MLSPWSVWKSHFDAFATRPRPEVQVAPPGLGVNQRIALARSLAVFQLGESGEGRIAHEIDRCRLSGIDDTYRAALRRFVAEEGRHGRILADLVRALDGSLLHRTWTDALFTRARRMLGMRLKLVVLLAAEVVGITFYGLLASRLEPSPFQSALEQICADEVHHLAFHGAFFRHRRELRWPGGSSGRCGGGGAHAVARWPSTIAGPCGPTRFRRELCPCSPRIHEADVLVLGPAVRSVRGLMSQGVAQAESPTQTAGDRPTDTSAGATARGGPRWMIFEFVDHVEVLARLSPDERGSDSRFSVGRTQVEKMRSSDASARSGRCRRKLRRQVVGVGRTAGSGETPGRFRCRPAIPRGAFMGRGRSMASSARGVDELEVVGCTQVERVEGVLGVRRGEDPVGPSPGSSADASSPVRPGIWMSFNTGSISSSATASSTC